MSTTQPPTRSLQDMLAERRSVVQEQRGESDKTARTILQYQIDELDRAIERMHPGAISGRGIAATSDKGL